ncbi:lytic transglycosylase domain-containing protein [Pedobacter hiemivivus]|uniref:LysM peptidoglycan-binding domain-containing protein n=1 Tax=Pedobacter hiemivivus TaxID=2530454 RepID=A0A4V2MJY8_9SPHI|nr:lytic transglycosylase domain-containing protein [Pedobacter hiemivivus]TCC96186.1 LysM peptidoglycan-binding domain-containing protein [Pedobacter hiemivivus]
MKILICFVSACAVAFTSFSATAQQQQKLAITDTTYVPVVDETPTFHNHNYVYKARLDSIQKTVPLTYNEFVQNYIDIYAGRKDMMGKMIGLSSYYFPIFEKALKSYNIPEEIKYLPIIESSMNAHAVSRVGATGLWQFMFATAKGYGLNMDNFVDERKDPIQASYAAAAYFRDAYEELGDWLLAIAAYNCGMGNVNRAIAKADSRDFWEIRRFLPMETRNYVPAFIAAVYVMNYSGSHQIKAQKSPFLKNTDTIQVNRFVSLPSLAEAMNIDVDELWSLNPSYKKKIVNGSVQAPKRVILPKVDLASFTRVYQLLNEEELEVDKHIVLASNDGKTTKKAKITVHKPSISYHKVASGQNLSTIANKYNVEVQDLKVWNNLKGSSIVPGQRLKIYHQAESKHVTRPMKG